MLQYDMVVCTYIGQITAISADNLLYRQISVVSADIVAYRQIICKCRYICISVRQIICICRYAKKLYRSYSTSEERKELPEWRIADKERQTEQGRDVQYRFWETCVMCSWFSALFMWHAKHGFVAKGRPFSAKPKTCLTEAMFPTVASLDLILSQIITLNLLATVTLFRAFFFNGVKVLFDNLRFARPKCSAHSCEINPRNTKKGLFGEIANFAAACVKRGHRESGRQQRNRVKGSRLS